MRELINSGSVFPSCTLRQNIERLASKVVLYKSCVILFRNWIKDNIFQVLGSTFAAKSVKAALSVRSTASFSRRCSTSRPSWTAGLHKKPEFSRATGSLKCKALFPSVTTSGDFEPFGRFPETLGCFFLHMYLLLGFFSLQSSGHTVAP